MSGIIGLCLILVIGLALTPTIAESVNNITHANNGTAGFPAGGTNLTGAARAIMTLVPLFWVILVIGVVMSGVVIWLRSG